MKHQKEHHIRSRKRAPHEPTNQQRTEKNTCPTICLYPLLCGVCVWRYVGLFVIICDYVLDVNHRMINYES